MGLTVGSISDAELWCSWCAGDKIAGKKLFDRYFDAICRFFVNKVHGDHDDLVQETFTACIRARTRLQEPGRFRAYLYGTANKVLYNHYRRTHASIDLDQLGSLSVHDLAPGPSTLLRAEEQRRLLAEALRQIPLDHQVAVELSYWEDMNSVEIGQVLGLPAATVRTRLRRARQLLADVLERIPAPAEMRSHASEELNTWASRVHAGGRGPS